MAQVLPPFLLPALVPPSLPRGCACGVRAFLLASECGGNRRPVLWAFRHALDGLLAEMPDVRSVFLRVIQPVVLAVRRAERHVLRAVICFVLVHVVNGVPRWDGTVNGFPDHAVLQFPPRWCSGNFDQNVAVAVRPSRADRQCVPRRHALFAHGASLPELRYQ